MGIEKNTSSILKHEQSAFTTTLNETIVNIRDPAALGIYTYLASKPQNWEISTKNLMNQFHKGRDFINERLKYLRRIGALIVNNVRDEKGRFIRRETLLKRTLSDTTTRKTQSVDNPECGGSLPTNKRTKQKKDINTNTVDSGISQNGEIENPERGNRKPRTGTPIPDSKPDSNNTVDSVESPPDDYKDSYLFMMFYALYPNKQKPRRAYKVFLKLKPDEEFVSMLCNDVRQRVEKNWKNRHKSKIPHPATYLNDREWEGELYTNETKQGSQWDIEKVMGA